jgi:hypothetical protein
MNLTFTEFEFNYASFSLTPYTGSNSTSTRLLKSIICKLNEPDFPKGKKLIDRNKNQTKSTPRQLVMISNRIEDKGIRCFGRIALIKNKAPMLWNTGMDIVEEIDKPENKQFIEVTNYVIHFNNSGEPVFMIEFNNEGPRLSDIDYYLRQIAKEFNIAKYIKSSLHLKVDIAQLDKEIRNVFDIVVKVKSVYSNRLTWFKTLQGLNEDCNYKDVKLELFFKRKKDNAGKFEKNIKGTDFARNIITWLKKDDRNIEYMDDLKMSYQCDDDNIVDLDFIKNRVVSLVTVPIVEGKSYDQKEYRFAVSNEFNKYLTTGKTNSDQ